MKISAKVSGACSAIIVALLLMQGWLHVARFGEFYDREVQDDLVLLASTLAETSDLLIRSGGEDAALDEFVLHFDRSRAGINVEVVEEPWLGADATIVDAKNGRQLSIVEQGQRLVAQVQVDTTTAHRYLLVSRSTLERDRFMQSVLRRQGLVFGALAFVAALCGFWVTRRLIEAPVQEMMQQAQRVSEGDFHVPLRTRRRDELGQLQTSLDAMSVHLANARLELERRGRDHTKALNRLRHADRLSTVGKLASGLAHELGTPLNVVIGRAKMLLNASTEGSSAHKNARVVVEQAERVSNLVGELMNFARRSAVTRTLETPGAVVDQAITLLEPVARECGVDIEREVERLAACSFDSQKILQVLTNLMMNAIHAMPDGGQLRVGVREVDIKQAGHPHAEPGIYLAYFVDDEGTGMDADTLAHALEPFFTTKGRGEGTGLGLSVCDGIVREHGGWIDVDSAPGRGSRFIFYIPLRSDSPAQAKPTEDVT